MDSKRPETLRTENDNIDNVVDDVKRMPEHQQKQVMAKLEMHSGPIPDPKTLEGYEKLYPGAAKSIIDNGVEEGKHRRSMEKEIVDATKKDRKRRDWMAFALGILGMLTGAFLIHVDHYITGSIFSGASLLGLVGMFLDNSDDDNKDE
ncbi:DUF2335 domain-containing protein [Lactiplantibacillus plantarum]|uniref:DUF2335 domain-containing protein n=1 Tax=Lactiplantibacillus plantarum TaxID=1590 RepID=UPI001BAB7BA1|nr:DUF2335 domain-containing protein [Lactiplantibacillus plantarum]MBS0955906.1 DUF2335 domain-containing protein [Lactiplantibacillus plantarum]